MRGLLLLALLTLAAIISCLVLMHPGQDDTAVIKGLYAAAWLLCLLACGLFAHAYLKWKRRNGAAKGEREEFCAAARQSGQYLLRYDIAADTVQAVGDRPWFFGGEDTVHDFSQKVLPQILRPESRETARHFFSELCGGKPNGECDLLMQTEKGKTRWQHMGYTLFTDKEGKPERAIISYYDNTLQREKEITYGMWKSEMEDILAASLCYMEVTLESDTVERVCGLETARNTAREAGYSYSAYIRSNAEKFVLPQDRERYLRFYDRERLMELCAGGIFSDRLDFRSRLTGEGKWLHCDLRMNHSPTLDSIKVVAMLTDINEEQRELEELRVRAERDPLTGILNRNEAEKRIRAVLEKETKDATGAFFFIDLDNLKQINDSRGHQAGDAALRGIARAISATLGEAGIIGRLGGDELMAYLPRCTGEAAAEATARALGQATQFAVEDLPVTTSIGVALSGQKSFEQLYKEADDALYHAKATGKNRFCIGHGECVHSHTPERLSPVTSVQLQSLMENMDGGVALALVDQSIHIQYISPSFQRLIECSKTADLPQDCNLLSFIYPPDVSIVTQQMHRTAETGEVMDCVYRVGKEGTQWRHMRLARSSITAEGTATVISVVTDITEMKQKEAQLRLTEERYRIALRQTAGLVWEVDLATHTLYQSEEVSEIFGKCGTSFSNVPENEALLQVIHPDSEEDYRRMFADIYAEKEGREYILRVAGNQNGYVWLKAKYGFIRNAEGQPIRAIGVMEKIKNIDAEMRIFTEEVRFMKLIEPSLLGVMRFNVSKDQVEMFHILGQKLSGSYRAFFTDKNKLFFDEDELAHVLRALSPEALNLDFCRGQQWVMTEFRRRAEKEEPRWTSCVVRLTRHPVSGDLYAFYYMRDIEQIRGWELALSTPAEHDEMTLLYSKETLSGMFSAVAAALPQGKKCALTVMEVSGIVRLKAEQGLAVAQRAFLTLARLCRISINDNAIVGYLDESHIGIIRAEVESSEKQRDNVEEFRPRILKMLRESVPGQSINLYCGFVTTQQQNADFDKMLRCALVACNLARQFPGVCIAEYAYPGTQTSLPLTEEGKNDAAEHRILVADDDPVTRKILQKILSGRYLVEEAVDGAEAIRMLRSAEYEMVISDIMMPRMTGWDLLETMQEDEKLASVPVVIISVDANSQNEVKALNLGAVDVIQKPIIAEILQSRVRNIINTRKAAMVAEQNHIYELRYQQQSQLLWLAEHDELTGLFNRQAFYRRVREVLDANPNGRYQLIRWDIDNFKELNSILGVKACDQLLRDIGGAMRSICAEGSTYGRIEADHFVDLIPVDAMTAEGVSQKIAEWFEDYPVECELTGRIGVYRIDDPSLDPSIMCDRALLALRSIKGSFTQRIAYYDDSLRQKMIEEMELSSAMVPALENGEFEVYFQPQYYYGNGEIVGAEALARWRHPQKGMISPGVFIPIFERNGFVSRLDEFVWEKSCAFMREWMDREKRPFPVAISVNISRIDLYDEHLCDKLGALIEKYQIPQRLLKLEITESAYMQRPEQLIGVVKELQKRGFLIEMDDFGSGYSSLNTLKDVPVDVLKLDMCFLSAEGKDDARGGNILSSIIRMAHWLKLPVIAEGVETKAQADYLRSLCCNYMQGFYFSKPLPQAEFEALLKKSPAGDMNRYCNTDISGMAEFWDPSAQMTLLFDSFVGGAIILEYWGSTAEIVRSNDRFYQEIGTGRKEYMQRSMNILENLEEASRESFTHMLDETVATGAETECEIKCSYQLENGLECWVHNRARLLACNADSYLIYISVENISKRKNLERQSREQAKDLHRALLVARAEEERDRLVMKYLNALIFYYDYEKDLLIYQVELPDKGIVTRTVQNLLAYLPHSVVIHPDYIETYREEYRKAEKTPMSGTFEYVANLFGTGYHRCRAHYTSVADDSGKVFQLVGVVYDIEKEKSETHGAELPASPRP